MNYNRVLASRLSWTKAFVLAIAAVSLFPTSASAQATQMDAGDFFNCAVTTAGGVKCWGVNFSGQLGDGTRRHRGRPVNVVGLTSGVAQVAAGGEHACALTTAGGVKCWGNNSIGQLGDGTRTSRRHPVDVSGLTSGVSQLVVSSGHNCVLTDLGAVKCWGFNNRGQIGDGTRQTRLTPVEITGFPGPVVALDVTSANSCAVLASGDVQCWGWNLRYQVGDGTVTDRLIPTAASVLPPGIAQVTNGWGFMCVLTSSGGGKCLGTNSSGQRGDGDNSHVVAWDPRDVFGLTNGISKIDSGEAHTCALMNAGSVQCWGSNSAGQLGSRRPGEHLLNIRHRHRPGAVIGLLAEIEEVSLGDSHACARTEDGEILCWGTGLFGTLGDNGDRDHVRPSHVAGFGGIRTKISVSSNRRPAHVRRSVRFTARVRPVPTGGRVRFSSPGRLDTIRGCGKVPVMNGVARCLLRYSHPGVRRVRAQYLGHVRFNVSRSPAFRQRIRP